MERWIMNRIGFLNFWLYDDEEFPLKDGKLLLRGSNASGKSITTQSFIPFILDGNRRPERLDPFGGSARKMEFYLLGSEEESKDASTGYLFMEFKKPSANQYRTIAIGLHARKNGPMTFWGFCVLDNRRIGYDLMLYNEAGKSKIPLSKIEMRNRIGDGGIFVETAGDYKEMVNRELFGFPDLKTYDQFISLLIKVRAPKLSKESTRPAEVYNILNSSLQTLTQDDLRAMVDSMEKIESLQNQLDDSKNALVEGKRLSDEYDRYSRYVLGKKADAYLSRYSLAKEYNTKATTLEARFINEKEKSNADTARLEEAKFELAETNQNILALSHDDIKRKSDEWVAAKSGLKLEQELKAKKLEQQSSKKDNCDECYREQKALTMQSSDVGYEITGKMRILNEFEEFAPPQHDYYVKQIENKSDFYTQKNQIARDLDSYRAQISKARDAFKEQESAFEKFDSLSQEVGKLEEDYDKAQKQLSDAITQENAAKDEIIEGYYRAQKSYKVFAIDDNMVEKLNGIIKNYEQGSSFSAVSNIILTHQHNIYRKLDSQKSKLKNEKNELFSEHDILKEKLDIIIKTPDPVPPRSQARDFARAKLRENNIAFRSFYECVDFSGNMTDESKALLEEQLRDMGILDAIIVGRSSRKAAENVLKSLSDCLVDVVLAPCKNPLSEQLKVTEQGEIADEVNTVLNSISVAVNDENSKSVAAINPDGTYQNGILFGHSISTSPSCFIGVNARREFKASQIAQITELLRVKQLEIDAVQYKISDIEVSLEQLELEVKSLPNIENLDAAIAITIENRNKQSAAATVLDSQNYYLKKAKEEYDRCRNDVAILSQNFKFRKTLSEYEMAISEILNYSAVMQDIMNLLEQKQNAKLNLDRICRSIEEIEYDLDQISSELSEFDKRIRKYSVTIDICDKFLNSQENRDIAAKIKSLNIKLNKLSEEISVLQTCQGEHKTALFNLSEQINENSKLLLEKISEEEKFSKYFEEELALRLVIIQGEQKLLDCAKLAVQSIKAGDEKHPMQTMQSRLEELFQSRTGALTSHYVPEFRNHFETVGSDVLRTRKIINLTWGGKKISPIEFVDELKRDIELKETIIREEDENLFKDVLSDTLSKKLYSRINESIRWVQSMSTLMKDIDTSMDLKFSLEWKPRRDMFEGEMTFAELDSLLAKDSRLLRAEDFQKVTNHFRSKINIERQKAEELGEQISYPDLVSNALDYRNWFEFKLNFKRGNDPKKELTNAVFNQFSGGERAMAMYVPLFAAVSSQYKKADEQCPFMIALDEAFAGVDEQNISSMFALLEKLGFGYIINSQSLWGCYKTVSSLEIAELYRPSNAQYVTVLLYQWNGVKKSLDTGEDTGE